MSFVILDAMKNENNISSTLDRILKEKEQNACHFKLRDMNIIHCRSCGACGYKSPGKCVFKDDMHEVLRAAARCSTLVMLTPVRFGGYTSELKKAVDKIALMALPSYTVKYGHILHPSRYGHKILLGIGVVERELKEQEESFKRLIDANALNLQYMQKTLIIRMSNEGLKLEQEIRKIVEDIMKPQNTTGNRMISSETIEEVQ